MTIEFSPIQGSEIKNIINWYNTPIKKPFYYLAGYAGTGKTTLAKYISQELGCQTLYGAYTGKAALVMRKNGCLGASTIHSMIYKPVVDKKNGNVNYVLNRESDVGVVDLVIIDECSMVDDVLGNHLMSFNTPVLVLGDPAQLPPVKGAGYFTNGKPDGMLTEIHRQAADNPIIHLATKVRNKEYLEVGQYGGSKVTSKFIRDEVYESDQFICGLNRTRVAMNSRYRKHLGFEGIYPMKDEKLICLKNNKDAGMLNGEMYDVLADTKDENMRHHVKLTIESVDRENASPMTVNSLRYLFDISLEEPDWKAKKNKVELTYGYALTAHKCLHPDTLVDTDFGFTEIKNIPNIGLVYSIDGPETYKNKVFNETGKALEFICDNGYDITTTLDHGMIVIRDNVEMEIESLDVKVGDFLKVDLNHKIDRPYITDKNFGLIDENFGKFLGLMVADGYIDEKRMFLGKRHFDVSEYFENFSKNVLGFGKHSTSRSYENFKCYEYNSVDICGKLIKSFGDGLASNDKKIPTIIKKSPNSVQIGFLCGLFEDGSVTKDGIEFTTSVKSIADWVHVCLSKNGIISTKSKYRNQYRISIYSSNVDKFVIAGFEFISKNKNMKMYEYINSSIRKSMKTYVPVEEELVKKLQKLSKNYSLIGNWKRANHMMTRYQLEKFKHLDGIKDILKYHYVKVLKIKETSCETMCIEVPSNNIFIQNGMVGKNCQGSQWENTYVYDESSVFRDDWWRWMYTAITRASENTIICV